MIKKIACLFLLLCCFASLLQGQEVVLPTKANFLSFGVGIPINTSRDKANSILAYKGRGVRYYLRTEDYHENSLFRFQMTIEKSVLRPRRVRPKQDIRRQARLTDIHFSWGYYRRLGQEELVSSEQQYLGISYNLQLSSRKYQLPANNTSSFLLQNGFAIDAIDRRSLEQGDWIATTHLSIPFFNGVYRPTYIGLPANFNQQKMRFKDFLRQMEWGSFGVFTKVAIEADFDDRIRPWRANRYSLGWNFFRSPQPKGKSLISTTASLSTGFNILL